MKLISGRRLVSTTLGIILAVAIIFSIFTITNNAAKSQIYEDISHMPYQFALSGEIPVKNYTKAISAIREVPHVDRVDAYMAVPMKMGLNGSYFMVAYWDNMRESVSLVKGRLPHNDHEMALSYWFATTANITIGTNLNVTKYNYTGMPENISYRVVGIFYYHSPVLRADAITTGAGLARYGDPKTFVAVKVNTTYLLSSLDVNEINTKIWNVKMQVESIIEQYGGYIESTGNSGYVPYINVMQSMIYVIYALPIIVMGIYLSKVGVEIEINERRREFGVMQVRGAPKRYMAKLFLYELGIYSVVGGIFGYILGEAMSYAGNLYIYHLPYFVLDVSVSYAISGIIVAALMFLVAFYFNWKRIKGTKLLDLLSHFASDYGKINYKPTKDLVYSALLWGYIITGLYLVENTSFNGGLTLIVVLAAIIAISFVFVLPIILVLLPLYMVRLLTLGTQRVYHFILKPVVWLLRVSKRIAEYGVTRNPKNMAYVAFILAFVLTFASLVSVTQDNEIEMHRLSVIQSIGGDFEVDTHQFSGSLPLVESIANSKNQSAHVWIEWGGGSIFGSSITLYFASATNYTHSVYSINEFIVSGTFSKNGAVITKSIATKYGLNVGDRIAVNVFPTGMYQGVVVKNNDIRTYNISGIVYSLPGLTQGEDAIFVDSHVTPENSTSIIFKAKNYDALKKELSMSGLNYDSRGTVQINQDAMFFKTAELFLVVLGGAAIFVINYSLYFNRRVEIALYRVRGASKSWIRRMLMAEGMAIVILSLLVGVVVGLSIAYFIISFLYSSVSLPGGFIIGMNFVYVIIMMFFIFVVTEYLLSLIFSRTDPVEVIRSNGGEM